MDQKLLGDETWAKRFSSRSLENAHIRGLQSFPAFEVPAKPDVRLETLLETLAQAEAQQNGE